MSDQPPAKLEPRSRDNFSEKSHRPMHRFETQVYAINVFDRSLAKFEMSLSMTKSCRPVRPASDRVVGLRPALRRTLVVNHLPESYCLATYWRLGRFYLELVTPNNHPLLVGGGACARDTS